MLKPKGVLVSKVFMGEDFIEVKNLANLYLKRLIFLNLTLVEVNQKKLIYTDDTLKTL